jgi:hypothetical protein
MGLSSGPEKREGYTTCSGWSKAEFDSTYIREIVEKQNVILPIWLHVTQEDVYRYSPRLADKVGLKSSLGIAEIASKIAQALKSLSHLDHSRPLHNGDTSR